MRRTVVLLCLLCIALPVASQRFVRKSTTVSSSATVGSGYNVVDFQDVTFSGYFVYTLDVGSMLSAANPVWINIARCTFQSGSMIYVVGSTTDPTAAPVYINFINCSWVDGGFSLQNYFPASTQVTLFRPYVRINSKVCDFPGISGPSVSDARMAYSFVFYNLHLKSHSWRNI